MNFERFDPIEADAIILRSLSIMPTIITGSWDTPKGEDMGEKMHALVHLQVIPPKQQFSQTKESDQLHTPSYYDLAQTILNRIQDSKLTAKNQLNSTGPFQSIENLVEEISHAIYLQICPNVSEDNKTKVIQNYQVDDDNQFKEQDQFFIVQVMIEIPKLIRFAENITISITRQFSSLSGCNHYQNNSDQIFIDNITCFAIIGLLERERFKKQKIICSLNIFKTPSPIFPYDLDLFNLTQSIFHKISDSEFFTVEALADSIANDILFKFNVVIKKVKVRIEKPEAVSFALGAGVEIIKSI